MKKLMIGVCLISFISVPRILAAADISPYQPKNFQMYQRSITSEACCQYYEIARQKVVDYEKRLNFIKRKVDGLLKEEDLNKIKNELKVINEYSDIQPKK